ncbi:MAG: lysoplasmalogenase [Phyllobacteriaceae bacterium]|nr:lysoplasmalogenase [Phyllobacteriaceae bacterium]
MTQGLLLVALACAVGYLFMPQGRAVIARAIVKTVPVTLFAIVASMAGAPMLLVAALILCALGDLLLAFARPASDGDDRPDITFLAGLIAFLTGHVIYVLLFAQSRFTDMPALSWPIGAAMVTVAIILGRILFRHAGPLRWPVMAYVGAILAMGVTALLTGSWLVIAGAVLFMASDAILGMEKFVIAPDNAARRTVTGPSIWVLYVAAQTLILSAFI